LPLYRTCRAGRSSTASSALLLRLDSNERLDCAALVHGGIRIGDVVEVGLVVEDASWVGAARKDVGEQLRDIRASRGHPAAQPDVAKDDGLHRVLDAVGNADNPNDRAWPGYPKRRRHGLGSADTFECGV